MSHFFSICSRYKNLLVSASLFVLVLFGFWEVTERAYFHDTLTVETLHYIYIARGLIMTFFAMIFIIFVLEKQGKIIRSLKKTSKNKSTSLRMVSHDLKSPLSVLKMQIDMLDDQLLGPVSERQRELLKKSKATLSRSFKLIDEVINTELLEQGSITLHSKPLNLRDILEGEISERCAEIKTYNIQWQWNIPENLSCISADEKQMHHLFKNIVSNICDNTPSNGNVHIKIEDLPDCINLTIKNNYIIRENLTDDPSTIRHGIGLSICKQVCKLHGFSFETKKDAETFTTHITFLK